MRMRRAGIENNTPRVSSEAQGFTNRWPSVFTAKDTTEHQGEDSDAVFQPRARIFLHGMVA
jgi:hypothetical protein